jgi:nucleotide-binding universal stress UspA family protein
VSAIVVGYDGTEGAHAALAEALELAAPLGAEVVLGFSRHLNPAGGEVADMAAVLEERGRAILAEGVERARAAGVPARGEVVDGRAADGLAALAVAEGARMIVIGSNGERPLRGVLLGSTPYRLVHQAPVPVLVVRVEDPGA